MRYLVLSENRICFRLSSILIAELQRFDVRGEIVEVEDVNSLKREFRISKPDLVILVGSRKSIKGMRLARKQNVKCCFFYMSLLDSQPRLFPHSKVRKIYNDIPIENLDKEGTGSLLSDLIRKAERGADVTNSEKTKIAICSTSFGSTERRLIEELSKMKPGCEFGSIDCSLNLDGAIEQIEQSNAVVALDQFSNVLTAFSNVPLVNVYKSRVFKKYPNRQSCLNELLQDQVVKNFPLNSKEAIANELDLILSDHHYSAGMLEAYQAFKTRVGNRPFARQVVQEIIEWLED